MWRFGKVFIRGMLPAIFAGLLAAQGTGTSGDAPAGQQIFNSTCAACHGLDGQGGEHAPNIATEAGVQRKTDAEITGIVRKGIPGAGMPAFSGSLDDGQISSVVKYLRSLQASKGASSATGDAAQGHSLFFGEAHCSDCHMMSGKGGFLGADLSGYGTTHSPVAIRTSILDPSQSRDAQHGTATVVMRTGETYTGVLRNEDNFSVQMQTADGNFHLLDKTDVARIERDPKSLSHANYSRKLPARQIDDLVTFLSKAGAVRVSENYNNEEH